MSQRTRTLAACVATAAIVSGAGFAAAQGAGTSKRAAASTTGTAPYGGGYGGPRRDGDHRHGPGERGEGLSSLAKSLGVTTARLQTALQAIRPDRAAKPPREDRRDDG